ncbi:MAG: glutamate-5-semialdehyde dehydrogenase [Syntrophaceae bacterium]|nr:glutamate-5-semialdehyde dehydrogenase [Syntrophaceae bacterium]
MDVKSEVIRMAQDARASGAILSRISSKVKDHALLDMADELINQKEMLIEENRKDLAYAETLDLSAAMLERLTLKDATIESMAAGLREVAALPDPVGKVTSMWKRPNGLLVGRMRIPLGVIGIIYESRPNVTADAAALCLKSGNAVILRGGSEAINSNLAIARILQRCLRKAGIPEAAIQVIPTTEREAVHELLQLEELIDLIIPRGGEDLIRAVVSQSKIPVIKHYKGVCHIFVDADADLDMAINICMNAKTQRPAVCNAMETLLVHKDIAPRFLPTMVEK